MQRTYSWLRSGNCFVYADERIQREVKKAIDKNFQCQGLQSGEAQVDRGNMRAGLVELSYTAFCFELYS